MRVEIWDLNLRHLMAVTKIGQFGTINAAARAVNLTQPAITQALSRLETQLGAQLFERRYDGMVATPVAALALPRIEAALGHVDSPHVTMSRMRALLAIADTGSYVGAGLQTGLAVPSLHRAVNDLSVAMRRALLGRQGKGVFLTEAGRAQVRRFRLARVELEAALAEIAALHGRETRSIAIGAMPLSRARVLPAAITRFRRANEQVRLAIVEGSRAELVEPLRNGTLDLMIGALREPLLEPDLVQHPLFVDRLVVYGRKGHPLAGTARGNGPDLAALARYPWAVAARGAPLRDSFERLFADAGVTPPEVPIESGSVMMVRQVLVDSDFLTLLSPDQVSVEIEAGWLEQIATVPDGLARTIGYSTRASWMPTGAQRAFLADLEAEAARIEGRHEPNY